MKKARMLAVLAAALFSLTLFGGHASAQQPVRQPVRASGGGTIALLDVSYIFEKLPRFKQMMDQMKADVDAAEAEVKQERTAIQNLMTKLDQFKGTPDYKATEEMVAKRQGDLAVRIQLQKREFLQREAKIYHTVYTEIQQEVDYYCQANGIDMVLRFSGDPVDVEKPDSVLAYINRPVVTYAKDRDITPIILDHLQRRNPVPQTPPTMGTRPAAPVGPGVPFQR